MTALYLWLVLALQPLALDGVSDVSGAADELFVAANTAYSEGDFARAVAIYRSLLESGEEHPMLHYNLGNALLRRGELGHAIASYLRASYGAPRNQDVRANLAFARRGAKDAIAPPEPSAVQRAVIFWHYTLSRAELLWTLVAANGLFWAIAAARLFRPRSEGLTWAAAFVLAVALATAGSLLVHVARPLQVGVVVPLEVEARSGYAVDAVVRFKLHAGTEVRVEAREGGWVRVALPDGERGWVAAEAIEIVEL